jgi:hypothetical protein
MYKNGLPPESAPSRSFMHISKVDENSKFYEDLYCIIFSQDLIKILKLNMISSSRFPYIIFGDETMIDYRPRSFWSKPCPHHLFYQTVIERAENKYLDKRQLSP